MKQERILIQEDYYYTLRLNFSRSIARLRETLTADKLSEVGLSLTTEGVRDILSGGEKSEAKVRSILYTQLLSGYQLPAIKKSNEELANKLLKDFWKMVSNAQSAMSDFRFIPASCFYVDGGNRIEINREGESLLKEASNLYIDKPEQIEVYRQALRVLEEVKKLEEMTGKYQCNALGSRGVLAMLPGNEITLNPGNVVECHPDGIWMRAR